MNKKRFAHWGAIVGDVFGAPYENPKDPPKFDFPEDIDLTRDDVFFTDDTVLTVATMEALNDSSDDFGAYYKKWGLRYSRCGFGKNFTAWLNDDPSFHQSDGNGASMRISPLALCKKEGWDYHDRLLRVHRSIAPTHYSDDGKFWAIALWKTIRSALDVKKPSELDHYFNSASEDGVTKLWKTPPLKDVRREIKFSSRAADTVPLALACVKEGKDFESTLRLAISLGSDTDTVASMACAIAGALYGVPTWFYEFARRKVTVEMLDVIDEFGAKNDLYWKYNGV